MTHPCPRSLRNILLAIFAWREVYHAGVWAYEENTVTGKRRVVRWCSGGYSPVDSDWLEGGVSAGQVR